MAIDRSNSQAFNDAEKYSSFLIENLPEILLPDGFTRDVSDFMDGTTLNIPTVGTVSLQEVAEGVPLTFNAIDSGSVTLQITEYVGDAWFVSDEAREDHARLSLLQSSRAQESTRAMAEHFETLFLKACDDAQTNADPNTINGRAHRIASAETNNVASLDHFIQMKLAFDKSRAPQAGRIAIVDPTVEATLNSLTNLVNVSNNPMFEGIVTEGFSQSHKFVRNIFGWDIWTSDLLDKGSKDDGTTTIANGVANVFMSVASDQSKPIMRAWRRQPSTEGWRDSEERRDKFQVTARLGFGAQRVDTLGILITDYTKY